MVNGTTRPIKPPKCPGTNCIGGWVLPRASFDGCGKCRPRSPDNSVRNLSLSRPRGYFIIWCK